MTDAKKRRKARAVAVLVGLAMAGGPMSISMLTAPAAFAKDTTSGDPKGGAHGNTNPPPYDWKVVGSDGRGSAWDKFIGKGNKPGLSGMMPGTAYRHMLSDIVPGGGDSNLEMIKKCQNSKYIWWVQGKGNLGRGRSNLWKWNGDPWPTYPAISGTYSGRTPSSFPKVADNNINQNVPAYFKNASKNPTVVCSNDMEGPRQTTTPTPTPTPTPTASKTVTTPPPPPPPPPPNHDFDPSDEIRVRTQEFRCTKKADHTWFTQILMGLPEDFVGKNNLHTQPAKTKLTKFGDMANRIRSYLGTEATIVCAEIDSRIATDKTTDHAITDLDTKNREGMAEGGVLNVKEQTKEAQINIYQKTYFYETRSCTPILDEKKGEVTGGKTCGPWHEYRPRTYDRTYTSDLGWSPKDTAFWQMLAVHCNEKDFLELVRRTGAQIVQTGNPETKLAAMAYTKKYDTQPAVLDFAQVGTLSATLPFYDKECPLSCVKDLGPGEYVKPGNDNGTPNKKGAYSPNKNGNYVNNKFIFFRDNMPHELSLDVWRPKTSGILQLPQRTAISTTVTRDPSSTPGIQSGDNGNGGEFNLWKRGESMDKSAAFFAKKGEPTNQRNFDSDDGKAFQSEFGGLKLGEVKDFDTKSTWASQDGKPVQMSVKWEYNTRMSTSFANSNIGFDKNRKVLRGPDVPNWANNIQGKCYAEFGVSNNTMDTKDMFYDNTGTKTENKLDTGLPGQPGDEFSGKTGSPSNLLVKFVRATTE